MRYAIEQRRKENNVVTVDNCRSAIVYYVGTMTDPLFDFTDKTVLITGGSRGMGRAMALAFAERGANIVVASRKIEACQAVALEVEALGRQALPVACHVAKWDDIGRLVDESYERFGKIDVLINNAGMSPLYKNVSAVTEELFDKVVGVYNIESEKVGQFNEDDRQFAEIFGRYVGMALNILNLLVTERCTTSGQITDSVVQEMARPRR